MDKEREKTWVWLYDGRAGVLTGRKFGKFLEVILKNGDVVFSDEATTTFTEEVTSL